MQLTEATAVVAVISDDGVSDAISFCPADFIAYKNIIKIPSRKTLDRR